MSGEPQLERSVLEGKERDKLQAIADALGLKIPARAKKTDLIDGILRATGVEVGRPAEAEVAKPRRAPRKRAAEATSDGNGAGEEAAPAGESGNGQVPVAEQAAATTSVEPEAGTTATDAPDATGVPSEGAAAPAGEGGDPAATATPVAPEARPPAPRPTVQTVGPPGPGNALNPAPANHAQQAPAQHHPGQPSQPGQPGQPTPAEGGEVRRNRRRRGRDRDRAGYDQQAQQADQVFTGEPIPCDGLLDLRPEGFGFLRTGGYLPGPDDVYVSTSQVRKFALRAGDRIVGGSRPATTQERFGALLRIDAVGDLSPDEARRRPRFEDLTPVFPDERLALELGDPAAPATTTGRIIDLVAPVGKGQRGLIVSPPKVGRSTVLRHIASAVEANHPDVEVVVLLVDERPEEVTDMRGSLKGEVIGSTFDRLPEEHTNAAELAVEVAKRRVELGGDVVLIVDGLTRLARAYNASSPPNGRVTADGIDPAALLATKRLLGAARNVDGGGSLTILATALADSGSAVDTVVLEEVSDTANMELRLERPLADGGRGAAIDVVGSSTLHEDVLLGEDELRQVAELRRSLAAVAQLGSRRTAYEQLLDRLRNTRTNAELLARPAPAPA